MTYIIYIVACVLKCNKWHLQSAHTDDSFHKYYVNICRLNTAAYSVRCKSVFHTSSCQWWIQIQEINDIVISNAALRYPGYHVKDNIGKHIIYVI